VSRITLPPFGMCGIGVRCQSIIIIVPVGYKILS
jgi:hypothetical protein